MGEAGSRTRPQNSLLEEDLEFERALKTIPVITEETVQALEDRIKARIMEGRFDDVVRIRPLDDKPFLPSRLFDLKDTKSAQSLAQIYETEFLATQAGGASVDDRDGKLGKEHHEIEQLWESICSKLDALCNAHFTPKQVSHGFASGGTHSTTCPTAKSDNLRHLKYFCSSSRICSSYYHVGERHACARGSVRTSACRTSCPQRVDTC